MTNSVSGRGAMSLTGTAFSLWGGPGCQGGLGRGGEAGSGLGRGDACHGERECRDPVSRLPSDPGMHNSYWLYAYK